MAELEYVRYLHDNGASVSNVISSKDGNLVDAFEVEESTGESYLDDEDLEELCECLMKG